MLKPLILILTVLTLANAAAAQQPVGSPAPTPKPVSADDVVKISTNLIQMDVTVTDKHGRVVSDLRPEEFEVYENGKRQNISNFSFVSNVRATTETDQKPAVNKPQVAMPPMPIRPEQVRRSIALVVDDLSLSFESIYYTRRALKKFVDEQMQDGDLIAIVRTGSGMGALQQFTTDKRQLYAAIERIRWNPIGNGHVGAFAPMEAKVDVGPTPQPEPGDRTPEGLEKEQESFRTSVFSTGTLGAINYVVRGMEELPGRKSIMLISEGFKLYEDDAEGFKESGRVLDALHHLVDAANRASVVIYTMDARGLAYTGLTAADNTNGRTAAEVESQLTDRRDQLFDTQDGLRYLAQQTGGISIVNNNDLSGGIRKILDDQSYYLIGYLPPEETFDPKTHRFNDLAVKVKRPGVTVRYRSGFYGVTGQRTDQVTSAPVGRSKLFNALTSPFGVGQVPVRLNAIFSADEKGIPFVRTLLHIDLRDIKFEELPDNSRKAVVDILVVAYGDNGMVVDQSGKTYTLTFPPETYEKLLRDGVVHIFTFPVKKPGAYQLRVAIRDTATDKVGSSNQFIEIPNLKKNNLVTSGIVLENISVEDWKNRNNGAPAAASSSVMNDTSTRQFKKGTVLDYAFTVFNATPGSVEAGSLEWQIRLFRDGKMIFEGKPQKATAERSRPKAVDLAGSLMLGAEMAPGDYILQITAIDKMGKAKKNTTSQFVQFEIVE